jgi:dihydrolipoamide dehydrogenase
VAKGQGSPLLRRLAKSLQKQGLTILTSAGVESLVADAKGVTVKIKTSDGKVSDQRFSHAIVAVGIVPNTQDIGLESLGVKTTKGHIDTDEMCRTNVPGIWAIGDVTAPPWLAHKASHEGVTAAEAIARELGNKDVHPHAADPRNIPGCTYCRPQVASVGLTEAKAKEAGYEVKVGKFPAIGNGLWPARSGRPRRSAAYDGPSIQHEWVRSSQHPQRVLDQPLECLHQLGAIGTVDRPVIKASSCAHHRRDL